MKYNNVFMNAIGYHLPEEVVSTQAIEERIQPVYDTLRIPVGQLEQMTGIKERRWWPQNYKVADGAAVAAINALDQTPFSADDLDILIYAGVCRDYYEPATACAVANELGMKDSAMVYDLSNACLGVLNGIVEIANRIELGQVDVGMVVSCESSRDINEDTIAKMLENRNIDFFKQTLATLTGGSGAVAIVLSNDTMASSASHRIIGGANRSDNRQHELCRWGVRRLPERMLEQFLSTDAIGVMKYGVQLGVKTFAALLAELKWAHEAIDKTISHQVSRGHRASILKALGLKEACDFPTFDRLGNMGTVSLPLSAAMANEQGFLVKGDRVGFLGIGSGLNCLMLGVEW